MAKHLWTFLCEKASIDASSNNVSLFGIIEEAYLQPIPSELTAIPVPFTIVTAATRDDSAVPEDQLARVDYVFPDRTSVNGPEFMLNMTDAVRARMILNSQTTPIKGEGVYRISVKYQNAETGEWREVGSYSFELKSGPPPRR